MRPTRGSVMAIVGLAPLRWARLAHSATARCSGGSVLPTPSPIITTSTEPHKVAPTCQHKQRRRRAKWVQISPARSKNWSHARRATSHDCAAEIGSAQIAAPRGRAGPDRSGGSEPSNAARSGGCGPSGASSYHCHSVLQRAGQPGEADVTTAASRARVAAVPIAPAEANSPAAVPPRVIGSGYAIQVTSERSESNAQAALQALQAKYPNQLSGRQPIIRRADLGAKGTYYRVLVGAFASVQEAAGLCSRLKAAGGNCIVQRN